MLVTQAEYARMRNVSRQYVGRLVKKGVIGLSDGKLDAGKADAVLAALREPARPERKTTAPAAVVEGNQRPASHLTTGFTGPSGDLPTVLLKSRIKSEVVRARLLEIKADVEAGKFVDAAEVKTAAFNKARVVRDGLLNIPDRLAAMLATESDATRVHEILTTEIRAVLEELIGASERD